MTATHYRPYTTEKDGSPVFLVYYDNSPLSDIVIKIGSNYYNGLRNPLPPATAEWCKANIK